MTEPTTTTTREPASIVPVPATTENAISLDQKRLDRAAEAAALAVLKEVKGDLEAIEAKVAGIERDGLPYNHGDVTHLNLGQFGDQVTAVKHWLVERWPAANGK